MFSDHPSFEDEKTTLSKKKYLIKLIKHHNKLIQIYYHRFGDRKINHLMDAEIDLIYKYIKNK
jgi:hypothetical protein